MNETYHHLRLRKALYTEFKRMSTSLCSGSGLLKKYSVAKMLLELHKLRKAKVQNNKEITTEIMRKQKDILESFCIKPENVPAFLKD